MLGGAGPGEWHVEIRVLLSYLVYTTITVMG